MKHTFRETLTVLSIFAGLLLTGWVMRLVSPWFFEEFGRMALVPLTAGFLLVHGLGVFGYLSVLEKLFPLRPGVYAMRDAQCSLWKHHTLLRNTAEALLRPVVPLFLRAQLYRLAGARMGKDVAVSGTLEDPYLTTIGDHAIIGKNACITGHALVFDCLRLDPVLIGRGATVGVNAVIMPGVHVGDYSIVAAGSVVPPGTEIPAGELWGGVPARRLKSVRNVPVQIQGQHEETPDKWRTPEPIRLPVRTEHLAP